MDGYKFERYKPGSDFEQVQKEQALLDINVTDSTELWLIQMPLNQLTPGDFEGRELSLKLSRDRKLGTFESSSGKSYDLMNVGTKEPNASVFLPSGSVGRIAKRVCLVRYPEPKELAKPRGLSTFALSNHNPKETGYFGKTKSKYSTPTKSGISKSAHNASHETQAPALSGQGTAASASRKKRRGPSEGGSSHVSGTISSVSKSQFTDSDLEHSSLEKKKKKVQIEKRKV